MAERIKLPLLTGFRVSGFAPSYSADVSLSMLHGAYVILGGNGLGKTTLMQAVVYGLAGGADDKIEEKKWLRWSSSYFRGRLSPTQIGAAEVEVRFRLGDRSIAVRRGFKGPDVLAVREGNAAWTSENAGDRFAEALRIYGGYLDVNDFAFVVHRLLYLPESRRLIAWDTDAQIRLLMLLNQDITPEREFRQNRSQLRLLDSKKRHIRVALNKAERELASLLEYESDVPDEIEEEVEDEENQDGRAQEEQLPQIVEELNVVMRKRAEIERRERDAVTDLSRVSLLIEKLRDEIERSEAGLIANFLTTSEREQNLALGKLVENAICPACGTHAAQLADAAQVYLRNHQCVLCGSDEPHVVNPELAELRDDLDQQLREQQAFEEIIRLARDERQTLQNQELDLQARVNQVRDRRSAVAIVERNLPEMTAATLKGLKQHLENEEAEAELQMTAIRSKLEADYAAFRRKIDARMDDLRASYTEYATAFLGLPCQLEEIGQKALLELKLFVPSFDGIVRPTPESCSEAQRFFLDIAFRLSLIASASNCEGTFFCETPETALDISYIDNVVTMFSTFSKKRHNILLTANVQTSGIAEKIVTRLPKAERQQHVIDLLQVGRLSDVQVGATKAFRRAIRRMMTAPQTRTSK
jgi:hypothetical protein